MFANVAGGHPSRPSLKHVTSEQTPVWEADPLLSELKARLLAQTAAYLLELSEGRFTNVQALQADLRCTSSL